jgi:alginate O-acetyltransferase complex protein AlgJ
MPQSLAIRARIALFIAVLCAPLVGAVLGVRNDPKSTMFEEHQRPTLRMTPRGLLKYVRELQANYNVDFAFREPLIDLHARLKVARFGVSSAKNVTLGKDGWLFYAGEQIVADFQRLRPFSDAELAAWGKLLTDRQHWLAARGIEFVFYVAPNPQTLYPEYMPDSLWRADNPSRMDQLIAYLTTRTNVHVLDMRPPLLAAKPYARVVYKTDSHWNQLGGFIAYQQLSMWAKQRFAQWRPHSIGDFEQVEIPTWHGGLSYFLGKPELFAEPRIELRSRSGATVLTDGMPMPTDELFDAWFRRRRVVRHSFSGEMRSVVILRDSQFAAPGQFLTRHFQRSVLLWTEKLDPAVIEAEQPQLVVFAIAERLLMNPVPVDPPRQ